MQGVYLQKAHLIQAQQHDQNTAQAGDQCPVSTEQLAQRRETQPQHEEGEAHAQNEKQGVAQRNTAALLIGQAGTGRAACQIAQIERHQWQHAGREKTKKPLYQYPNYRKIDFEIKPHKRMALP